MPCCASRACGGAGAARRNHGDENGAGADEAMTAQAIEGPATGRSGRETAAGLQRADATKARPVRLRRKMSVGDAFGIIAASCLDHLLDNQPAALRRDPEAVHQMRVAIRRLRAAATLMKRMLRDRKQGRSRRAALARARARPRSRRRHPRRRRALRGCCGGAHRSARAGAPGRGCRGANERV